MIMETAGMGFTVRVHPDGQRIAFSRTDGGRELWVIENFLPQETGKYGSAHRLNLHLGTMKAMFHWARRNKLRRHTVRDLQILQ
jgi:hypothetical protein